MILTYSTISSGIFSIKNGASLQAQACSTTTAAVVATATAYGTET